MIPVIALVGRPNVGKSTLFNRLTRSRDALVADFPGLTRDRQYGEGKLGSRPFIVIDTGGITGNEEGLDAEMAKQSLLAIEEADLVLFMVDARAGLTSADEMLAQHLRATNKNAHLVINKTDGLDAHSHSAEFYALGMAHQPWLIAATQNRGVSSMLNNLLDELVGPIPEEVSTEPVWGEVDLNAPDEPDTLQLEAADELLEEQAKVQAAKQVKVCVIGRPNVGKSTLVNRLLGEERVVVYDQPGTTRDSISIPFERGGKPYTLIDTAGIRRRKNITEATEKFSIVKTLQAIQEANVAILVIDAQTGLVEQDLHLLGYILESGRALVIAVNKWDNLEQIKRDRIKHDIDQRLDFADYAKVHFISALHGTGVGELFRSVEKAYKSATSHWPTNRLTVLLQDLIGEHQPPMVKGRRVKLRYAHQGGINPPIIVIHGNQTKSLPDVYKRYLMNGFRRVIQITGTPMRFEYISGTNPYATPSKDSREAAKARQLRLTKEARQKRQARRK